MGRQTLFASNQNSERKNASKSVSSDERENVESERLTRALADVAEEGVRVASSVGAGRNGKSRGGLGSTV